MGPSRNKTDHPSQPDQQQALSFTDDLPTEVRLRVYQFLFDSPGQYLELWGPDSFGKRKWQNIFRAYESRKKLLRIMRLNKKIREEVADYFYGQLNMRFSSEDGFYAMAVFNHTIQPLNCSFIRHITVAFPCNDIHYFCMRNLKQICDVQRRRGMRLPRFRSREMNRSRGGTQAACDLDLTVHRGFRQLGSMTGLKLLEILIPWNYVYMDTVCRGHRDKRVPCECPDILSLSPENLVRHFLEAHFCNSDYLTLLANLKEQSSRDDLTIALVYDYNASCHFEDISPDGAMMRESLRGGRWLAAYASVMGYKFGFSPYAPKGAYKVRYDEDTLMSKSLEELKADADEYDPLLEPPELSG